MSDSQSPSQPNQPWTKEQLVASSNSAQAFPDSSGSVAPQNSAASVAQSPSAIAFAQAQAQSQNYGCSQDSGATLAQSGQPIQNTWATQPTQSQPIAPNTGVQNPAAMQTTAPAPNTAMGMAFNAQQQLQMQQQAMLAQQMQYQANWLQLHYQQWLMGRVQALSKLWQQPEAVLWTNPQVQMQLQQEYRSSFDPNELYRQAALAVQAMGLYQFSPFGLGGAFASPATMMPQATAPVPTTTATTNQTQAQVHPNAQLGSGVPSAQSSEQNADQTWEQGISLNTAYSTYAGGNEGKTNGQQAETSLYAQDTLDTQSTQTTHTAQFTVSTQEIGSSSSSSSSSNESKAGSQQAQQAEYTPYAQSAQATQATQFTLHTQEIGSSSSSSSSSGNLSAQITPLAQPTQGSQVIPAVQAAQNQDRGTQDSFAQIFATQNNEFSDDNKANDANTNETNLFTQDSKLLEELSGNTANHTDTAKEDTVNQATGKQSKQSSYSSTSTVASESNSSSSNEAGDDTESLTEAEVEAELNQEAQKAQEFFSGGISGGRGKTSSETEATENDDGLIEDEDELQAEISKLALELERSRQQLKEQESCNGEQEGPYVELPFFAEQEAKRKQQEEALQARLVNSPRVKKVIELFERDDGLFNEANLFLKYIRDERHLSSATVNTYKGILLRAIVILEKVLPHPRVMSEQDSANKGAGAVITGSARSSSNELQANQATQDKGAVGSQNQEAQSKEAHSKATQGRVEVNKYRSLLRRSYEGELVIKIEADEALYYENWAQVELSTLKSLHRELNFGVKHQRRASASVAQNLHALSSFFNFLVLRGHLVNTPMEYLQAPKVKNALPRVLSEREVGLMLDSKAPLTPQEYRDLAMMELMYASGLRVAELVSLDLGDVDFDMREVRVLGKGNKERVVPTGSAALKALQAYLLIRHNFNPAPNEKALFLNHLGTRISTRSVQMKVRSAAKEANLEGKVTPHKLRHAFATQLLNNGVNLRMVQEMLGHANLATTQIYTHLDLKRLQDVYSKAHPLANATHSQEERDKVNKQHEQAMEEIDSLLKTFAPDDDQQI